MNLKARLDKLERGAPIEPTRIVVVDRDRFDAGAYRAAHGLGAHVPLLIIDTGIRRAA